jgi:hypothetical protein
MGFTVTMRERRRAKVSKKFGRLGACRRLMEQFVEPLGVGSDENPPSIGF